ncbi:MAG: prepilin-type N-terminal cleavage/methylation domain-containing protein [Rubrivivax sp.]|nr:prepilin-type N-terminal cleavage/methylation domain-containing protein [Rubrivivax sp.]
MLMRQKTHACSARASQRGLSLVELMVGITVGLFVVAAAATLVANQLGDNRRLLLETQVQQDLRSTMDIITRQMRRADAGTAANVLAGIAASPAAAGASSPFAMMSPAGAASSSATSFSYYFDATQQGPYGFKWESGVIKSRMRNVIGTGYAWQDLTDPNTLKVTNFVVTPRTVTSTALPCPNLCPVASAASDPTGERRYCWPQLVVRSFIVDIEAEAKSDPGVRRALRNEVRVRNDVINASANPVCPT